MPMLREETVFGSSGKSSISIIRFIAAKPSDRADAPHAKFSTGSRRYPTYSKKATKSPSPSLEAAARRVPTVRTTRNGKSNDAKAMICTIVLAFSICTPDRYAEDRKEHTSELQS